MPILPKHDTIMFASHQVTRLTWLFYADMGIDIIATDPVSDFISLRDI